MTNEPLTDERLDESLRGLPVADLSGSRRERVRALAHAAMVGIKAGRQAPQSFYARFLEPALVTAGATGYLIWAVTAVQAVIGPH